MTTEEAKKGIAEVYSNIYDGPIEWDKSFEENGMDSLDYVEFILEVERKFEMAITDEISAQMRTPEDLVHVVLTAFNPELDRPVAL